MQSLVLGGDILIEGISNRNRAVHGDYVAVRLLSSEEQGQGVRESVGTGDEDKVDIDGYANDSGTEEDVVNALVGKLSVGKVR